MSIPSFSKCILAACIMMKMMQMYISIHTVFPLMMHLYQIDFDLIDSIYYLK